MQRILLKQLGPRLSKTKGYVVAKLQDHYVLCYSPKPYQPHLRSPEGGHYRDVPHRIVQLLRKDKLIESYQQTGNASFFRLTKKGELQ